MPLSKQWHDLDRETISRVPDRPGVYELGDESGTVQQIESGILRDKLKTALAYSDHERVRWETTQTRAQAQELAASHRKRLE
jgi:excinuclease UvrABC nuclease subunit